MRTAAINYISVCKIFLLTLFLLTSFATVSAEVVTVQVCGIGSNENVALESAKKMAVEKVIARFIVVNQDPTSEFQQFANNYQNFVVSADVFKKQKSKGTISLYTKVQVDAGKIQDLLKNKGNEAQNKQEYLEACFLIRVTGLDNLSDLKSGENTVYLVCSDTFQRMGFRVTNSDQALYLMEENSSSEKFFRELLKLVDEEFPEITLAVVGEVQVDKTGSYSSYGADTYIHLRAVDMISRRTVAEFKEVYRARGNNANEAVRMSLEKAAMNASESLAEKSREYFSKEGD